MIEGCYHLRNFKNWETSIYIYIYCSPFKAAKALKQPMFPELKPTQKSCFLTPQKNFTGDRNNKNMVEVEDMQNISRWPKLVGLLNAMIHHCSTQIYIQDTFFQKETKQIQNSAPLLPFLLDTILQVQCSLPSIAKPRNRLPNTKNDSLQHRLWHASPYKRYSQPHRQIGNAYPKTSVSCCKGITPES